MPKRDILVVDDEDDILELLSYNLTREGFNVICAKTGEESLDILKSRDVDLIVLDLMLPGIQGFDVARELKSNPNTRAIPIIMLTAKSDEPDVLTGLELGADDYITKPFSTKILTARVKAVLRRRISDNVNGAIQINELTIHPGRHEVFVNGTPIELTVTEFSIIECLAQNPGWVYSRSQILDLIHGNDYSVTERSVDVQVLGLRRKLGSAGKYLETVRGVGYRIKG